ncbi:hypothetical protein [Streptomyces sp. NPDC054838]
MRTCSLIWVRWVLARHTTVLLGNVTQLVSDLEAETFFGGQLAKRLDAANVPGLKEPEQRRLGVAVGRRTAKDAGTVRIDGVRACSTNAERWPDAYRTGVIERGSSSTGTTRPTRTPQRARTAPPSSCSTTAMRPVCSRNCIGFSEPPPGRLCK